VHSEGAPPGRTALALAVTGESQRCEPLQEPVVGTEQQMPPLPVSSGAVLSLWLGAEVR